MPNFTNEAFSGEGRLIFYGKKVRTNKIEKKLNTFVNSTHWLKIK